MNRSLIIILCLFFTVKTFAQGDSVFHAAAIIKGDISDFNVDNLGNIFIINKDGQLKKLKPNGDSLAVFNDVKRYGKLHSIDASNPLKVLLFYKDFGTTVILDRFLSRRAILDFRRAGLPQIRAIGQAYDNNIWVFDDLDIKLKKISDDGRIIDQSTDFRLIFDAAPSPDYIIDQDKMVYLYDPLKGVYIFDYYGGFKNRIAITGLKDFNVINGVLFGRDDKSLYRYEIASLRTRELPIPEFMRNAQRIVIGTGYVYVLKDGAIMVYSYN
ncbi:MAG: hypothetical protein J7497_09615 [Chitinophagaceae bacterium]|nr:hypothetical protein [Chitinophagaceae bacterium]